VVFIKRCTKCKIEKIINKENFYKNKSSHDGFMAECKDCYKAARREYARNHKEEKSLYMKQYYIENQDQLKQDCWEYKQENKEYYREYFKQYQQSDTGKQKFLLYSSNKNKHDISNKQWIQCKDYFDNACCYCGFPYDLHKELFNQDLHKDHYDSNGSDDISNCVPACKRCNSKKRDYPVEFFYEKHDIKASRINKINNWLSEQNSGYN
jgi:hypothetical protein